MSKFDRDLNDHLSSLNHLKSISKIVDSTSKSLSEIIFRGNSIFICGNGGSAADSQHFASELVGRFLIDRKPLPAISLTTDTSALTSISNDFNFTEIFSRQLEALGKEGDALIVLSTSGNSKNLLKALKSAKRKKIKTFSLLGKNGGKIKDICDNNIIIRNDSTPRIQEIHILIIHSICRQIEEAISPPKKK